MAKVEDRCRQVQLVLSDVDGVLTDGGIYYDSQGLETKRFHVRDGLGIRLWQRTGFTFGVVTSRTSQAVKIRCAELQIAHVRQGVSEKLPVVEEIASSLSLSAEQVCYVGDDLPDLSAMRWAGLGVAVADAPREVRQAADFVTQTRGGRGAIREVLEMILRTTNRWDDLIRRY
ncbi:MAG: HAD hydrolase family protein [Planctomycetales bacterium]|nr:HAD hydrolase family protein [Planctomycetales bacterium]